MKKVSLFIGGLLVFALVNSARADLVLGWEYWNTSQPSQSGGDATGSASPAGGTWRDATQGASNDGDFGSLASPSASTSVGAARDGTYLREPGSGAYQFTVTAGQQDIDLAGFYFDTQRERSGSPENWKVLIVSGPVTNQQIGNGSLGIILGKNGPSDHVDIDISLTGLTDHLLEAGQSTVFRIEFSGGTGASNQDTYLDNVAVSGNFIAVTPVPEPATALLGMAGLAWMGMRRRLL